MRPLRLTGRSASVRRSRGERFVLEHGRSRTKRFVLIGLLKAFPLFYFLSRKRFALFPAFPERSASLLPGHSDLTARPKRFVRLANKEAIPLGVAIPNAPGPALLFLPNEALPPFQFSQPEALLPL